MKEDKLEKQSAIDHTAAEMKTALVVMFGLGFIVMHFLETAIHQVTEIGFLVISALLLSFFAGWIYMSLARTIDKYLPKNKLGED